MTELVALVAVAVLGVLFLLWRTRATDRPWRDDRTLETPDHVVEGQDLPASTFPRGSEVVGSDTLVGRSANWRPPTGLRK